MTPASSFPPVSRPADRLSLRRARRTLLQVAVFAGLFGSLSAANLRVVTYNVAADIDDRTTARTEVITVLQAIGGQSVNGVRRPVDLLALQETTSNATTVAPIVNALNSIHGAGRYAMSPYQGTSSGNYVAGGNGPNAVIYNASTLRLVDSVGISAPLGSTNGVYRQVTRYEFRPTPGSAANTFYVYVSHMKSNYGVAAEVQAARNGEAAIIRADAATLPADATFLCVGDYNLTGSAEAAYQTLTADGPGRVIDPLNLTRDYSLAWTTSGFVALMTASSNRFNYRDDFQFMSPPVHAGTSPLGLRYVAGSYRAFGNNGSVAYRESVNHSSNSALANVSGPVTPAQARAALAAASDHLPVVADYTIAANRAPTVKVKGGKKLVVRKPKYRIRGTAADADGDAIRVRVKAGRRPEAKASGAARWSFTVALKRGANKIVVRAIDASGNVSAPARLTITRP